MERDKNKPHAVIVGAGFGGLAAAIRLLVRGYRVTVVDRLDQAGGRARVFREDGFVWDAGPTVITAPFLLEELWSLLGEQMKDHVTLLSVEPFYQIRFDDGQTFDYSGSAETMKRQIAAWSPTDVRGYETFLKHSEEIFRVGFEQLAHVPFSTPWDMIKIVPHMIKLQSYRTVYGVVCKYIQDPRLRQVLSFHPLLVGGNPFNTTSIYALILYLERKWGVFFPKGGTGALVQGLVELMQRHGGALRLQTEVKEILVHNGRATGVRTNAETVSADIVVSNADSAWTYRHLLPERYRNHWTNARLAKSRYSMGLFVWYFGTQRRYNDVAHHTILLGPRYKELLEDIFERKILAEDFSLYLHRPTATDPTLAPEGCDVFYVLSPVPHLDAEIDWASQRERYRERIEAYLEKTLLPGLKKNLTASTMLDPQNFQEDYLAYKGSAFSFEPVLSQSAYFRPHNKSEEVERLYFVGAGTHPGAGVPGVLSSARILDRVVPNPESLYG